jgi:magnesium chelatase family protein
MAKLSEKRIDHVLLVGPPGSGKVLWAREHHGWCLDPGEAGGAVEYVRRAAGLPALGIAAPLRAPHHTVSVQAITGIVQDGWRWRPGELSLAHGGTLLLDEAPEFRRPVLDAVLGALADGYVQMHGTTHHLNVPARFRLMATMVACPCGGYPGPDCRCSERQMKRHRELAARLCKLGCRVVWCGGLAGRKKPTTARSAAETKEQERRAAWQSI